MSVIIFERRNTLIQQMLLHRGLWRTLSTWISPIELIPKVNLSDVFVLQRRVVSANIERTKNIIAGPRLALFYQVFEKKLFLGQTPALEALTGTEGTLLLRGQQVC